MDLNPEVTVQLAALINSLPEEQKKELLSGPLNSLGKGFSSLFDIAFYMPNSWALSLNDKLRQKAQLLAEETQPKIDKLKEEDKYTESGSGLAIKALELSKYSLDSEILREYFSQLIANSVNKDTINNISPNFASILGNLSESDALLLRKIKTAYKKDGNRFPIISIRAQDDDGSGITIEKDFLMWDSQIFEKISTSLYSLESFGLLEHAYDTYLASDVYTEIYDSMKKTEIYKNYEKVIAKNEKYKQISLQKGILDITELGQLFLDLVVV